MSHPPDGKRRLSNYVAQYYVLAGTPQKICRMIMREVEINVNICLCSYYCGECVCIYYAFEGATDAHVLKVVKVVKVRNTSNREA